MPLSMVTSVHVSLLSRSDGRDGFIHSWNSPNTKEALFQDLQDDLTFKGGFHLSAGGQWIVPEQRVH